MGEDLVFYTNPDSRGRIVRWMLEEVGADYHTEIVEYGPAMKSAEYLAVNPMGKVPAIRHRGTVVTETAAICAWLADAFPASGLAPPPEARGAYYRWLFFAAGPLEAAITNRVLGIEPPEDKQPMVGYGTFGAVMDTLEGLLSGGGYVAGASFTAADVYLGAQLGWTMRFDMIERRPAFEAYWERVSDRDAYRRATALDDAAASTLDDPAASPPGA